MALTILKGTVISAPALGRLDVTEGGYLVAEEGKTAGVFPVLPEGIVPCNFTVYANIRDHFQAYLAGHGIRSSTFWPLGPLVSLEGCPDEQYIYEHVISIPCDQRLDGEDMAYTASVLSAYEPPRCGG